MLLLVQSGSPSGIKAAIAPSAASVQGASGGRVDVRDALGFLAAPKRGECLFERRHGATTRMFVVGKRFSPRQASEA